MKRRTYFRTAVALSGTGAMIAATPGTALAGTGGPNSVGIINVPDIAGDWFLSVVKFADTTPPAVQTAALYFSEFGILPLVALWAVILWRSRGSTARAMAWALAGAAGIASAYGLSEMAKTYLEAERPCRTFPDVAIIAAECPPTGDWSFPSNHSAIAGAFLVALFLASRRAGLIALPIVLIVAASRTFTGVHYPHDVVAGLLLGAMVALTVALLLVRPMTRLVGSIRENPRIGRLLTSTPTSHPSDRNRPQTNLPIHTHRESSGRR